MHSKNARRRYHRSLLLSHRPDTFHSRQIVFFRRVRWGKLSGSPRDEQLTFHGSEFWPPPYPLHRLWQLSDSEMSVRGSHKIDLSANLHVTLIRVTGVARIPAFPSASSSLNTCARVVGSAWPQHPFLRAPPPFIRLHHACNPRLQKQLDPLFGGDADQSGL